MILISKIQVFLHWSWLNLFRMMHCLATVYACLINWCLLFKIARMFVVLLWRRFQECSKSEVARKNMFISQLNVKISVVNYLKSFETYFICKMNNKQVSRRFFLTYLSVYSNIQCKPQFTSSHKHLQEWNNIHNTYLEQLFSTCINVLKRYNTCTVAEFNPEFWHVPRQQP